MQALKCKNPYMLAFAHLIFQVILLNFGFNPKLRFNFDVHFQWIVKISQGIGGNSQFM